MLAKPPGTPVNPLLPGSAIPATDAALIMRLRVAEAAALIAECEPVIAWHASVEAQIAAQMDKEAMI